MFHWNAALGAANSNTYAGYSDWRLPNLKELRSLVEECRNSSAVNVTVFPNTPSLLFWSGSPYSGYTSNALVVNFNHGYATYYNRNYYHLPARLVRMAE